MHAHRFDNLTSYMAEFLAHLRIEQDTNDRSTFEVEVRSEGLTSADMELLQ